MSVGGSSNLGTLLIRRLDTAHSVLASQQSQLAYSARSNAISQLADAARVDPVHNQTDRPLPDSIERAQAQVGRQARQAGEAGNLQQRPLSHTGRPTTETTSTPSAPTTLGHGARTILALLALFSDNAPVVQGRTLLAQSGNANASAAPTSTTGGQAHPVEGRAPAPASSSSAPGSTAPAPGAATGLASTAAAGAASSLPAALAQALASAVQQSGVFYEAHLREWMTGNRSLTQLHQEPQALLGKPAGTQPTQPASGPTTATPTEQAAAEARNAGGPTSSSGQAATAQTSANPVPGVHPESHLLVRQQLEVLATQVFGWRGEAWPDAPMEWEISRRNEEGMADENGTHWATRLTLNLPTLGKVEARLSLLDAQVVMQLSAPDSANTLSEHDQTLRAAFSQAGLTLSQLSIQAQP